VATEGIEGLSISTRNYGATAAFWASLGYKNVFETDHGSGTWEHPNGGPYVFIQEKHDGDLEWTPMLRVADAAAFSPNRDVTFDEPFHPEHWGVMSAAILDPDGRRIGLQAPLPEGVSAPDADQHHLEKYGSA
jgi:hypothetical protein